jgi:Mor family transcriptional regulator
MSIGSNPIPDILQRDITACIQDSIGLHDRIAAELAANVVKRLQAAWGGKEIYIPAPDSKERNALIKADFNGKNHVEVCKKHGISLRTLYRVIG